MKLMNMLAKSVKCYMMEEETKQSPNDVFTFDVGGKIFKTTRLTLKKFGEHSWFGTFLSLSGNDHETYFLDRDPTGFELLIRWARGLPLGKLDEKDKALLYAEADYFSVCSELENERYFIDNLLVPIESISCYDCENTTYYDCEKITCYDREKTPLPLQR